MPPIHPHSDYLTFNLPATDPTAPLGTAPVRLADIPGLFSSITPQADILAAAGGNVFRDSRTYRYTGENEQGVDAAINHFQGIVRLATGRTAFFALSGGDSTEVVSHIFMVQL